MTKLERRAAFAVAAATAGVIWAGIRLAGKRARYLAAKAAAAFHDDGMYGEESVAPGDVRAAPGASAETPGDRLEEKTGQKET